MWNYESYLSVKSVPLAQGERTEESHRYSLRLVFSSRFAPFEKESYFNGSSSFKK